MDLASITIQAVAPATSSRIGVASGAPTTTGDCDGDAIADLMVKVDRAAVQSWFSGPTDPASLRLEGRLFNGMPFGGSGTGPSDRRGRRSLDQANPASVENN